MNSIKSIFTLFLVIAFSAMFMACKEDDPTPDPIVSTTISNLAADPSTGFNPTTGAPIGQKNKFTFFSFKTGATIDAADSATNKWDLGFRGTTIIVNSATSGPGTSQVQVLNGIFDDLEEAPAAGYNSDSDPSPIAGAPNANLAIPTGADKGWYSATATQPTIVKPLAGKIIVVKTSDGRYAKMEILSYYKDAPSSPTGTEPSRYYTFRYVYQPNDTKSFK